MKKVLDYIIEEVLKEFQGIDYEDLFDIWKLDSEIENILTANMKDRWEVCVHGEPCKGSWEISVALTKNFHAFESYGWIGDSKILIHSKQDHHRYSNQVEYDLFETMTTVAENVAEDFNLKLEQEGEP